MITAAVDETALAADSMSSTISAIRQDTEVVASEIDQLERGFMSVEGKLASLRAASSDFGRQVAWVRGQGSRRAIDVLATSPSRFKLLKGAAWLMPRPLPSKAGKWPCPAPALKRRLWTATSRPSRSWTSLRCWWPAKRRRTMKMRGSLMPISKASPAPPRSSCSVPWSPAPAAPSRWSNNCPMRIG